MKILSFKFSILLILISLVSCSKNASKQAVNYIHNEGKAQGTYYSATYLQPEGIDLQQQIDSFFRRFDLSLSTYEPNSIISKINMNQPVSTDTLFDKMFFEAQKISDLTHGAFDITVAPLVNAWGFGFKNKTGVTDSYVDSLMPLIGYKKVKLENHQLIKSNPGIMIDASAIAQGLSADLVAELFEKNGCEHYMIDIGGEIVCKGVNPNGKNWQIGIDKPIDDPENANGELQTIVSISNLAITTSGNYRKFYYKDGKKYAHTINPKTGKPVEHNLLCATVIAQDCTTADALATACMVLGKDSAMAICNRLKNIECYLVYTNSKGNFEVEYTKGFKKYLID